MNDTTQYIKAQVKKTDYKLGNYSVDGKYMKIADIQPLISKFRDFYFEKRIKQAGMSYRDIMLEFQKSISPEKFAPYSGVYKNWIKEWERNVDDFRYEQEKNKQIAIATEAKARIRQLPTDDRIAMGANQLGEKLLQNAAKTMEEIETKHNPVSDTALKGKKYVVSVLTNITKLAQGNKALALKQKADSREELGFFFDLLKVAKAGNMDEKSLELLKSSVDNPVDNF